jgi:hypothetical protein
MLLQILGLSDSGEIMLDDLFEPLVTSNAPAEPLSLRQVT